MELRSKEEEGYDRNWVPNSHTRFFRNQFLEIESRNQFFRNCDASKQALSTSAHKKKSENNFI
jgi:hypothetical protein